MNIPALFRTHTSAITFVSLLALYCCHAHAEEKPADSNGTHKLPVPDQGELLIVDGKIAGLSINGQSAAATVRNIVDVITERYPRANITIVDAHDVVIENLKV